MASISAVKAVLAATQRIPPDVATRGVTVTVKDKAATAIRYGRVRLGQIANIGRRQPSAYLGAAFDF